MTNFRQSRDFDYNLLIIFLCIYRHCSVTKAAKELCTSAPNISQSLSKLRDYFNDPLFVREGQKIVPTIFCQHLHSQISHNFEDINNAVLSQKKTRNVVVYCPESIMLHFITEYIKSISENSYPKVNHYNRLVDANTAKELFAFKKADIVVTYEPVLSASIKCIELPPINIVLICRKGHPRANIINAENIKDELSVVLSVDNTLITSLKKKINSIYHNEVIFQSDAQNININIIENSDVIGFVSIAFFEKIKGNRNIQKIEIDDTFQFNTKLYYSYLNMSVANNDINKVTAIFNRLQW